MPLTLRGVAASILVAVIASASAHAQAGYQPPRTADGHPDLQGVWSTATATPMERPDGYPLVLSPEQAAKIEAIKKIEAIIPEEVKIAAAEAKKKAEIVQAKYAEVSYDVERALLIVDLIMNADKYIAAMGAEAASIIMAEAKAELDRQLKANPPKKPKTKPKTEN